MRSRSLWHSFECAFSGLLIVVRTQRNAKIHLAIAAAVAVAAAVLRVTPTDWAILALTIGTVLAAEALNTVAESFVDLLSPEHHEQAGTAKDAAAAGVLILSIAAVVVGLAILGPPLYRALAP
jgi:diacylglycerol kinase